MFVWTNQAGDIFVFPFLVCVRNTARSCSSSLAVLCLLWHFRRMQWKLLLSSASCSLITHCKADRYFHQLHLSSGKSASFPPVRTQPVQNIYIHEEGMREWGRTETLNWVLGPWRDSGLLSLSTLWVAGHKDKWPYFGKSPSRWLTEQERMWSSKDTAPLIQFRQRLRWLCSARDQGHR